MNKRAVAWVISPINALQCLIAHQYAQQVFKEKIDLHIFHCYPTFDAAFAAEVHDVVKNIIAANGIAAGCEFISYPVESAAIPESCHAADYIFYAHDVVGDVLTALRTLSPQAVEVCYGDALGQLFNKEVHLGYLKNQPRRWLERIRTFFKKYKLAEKDYAFLSIPVTQIPLPRHTTLFVPPHEVAHSVITECSHNLKDLEAYCSSLRAQCAGHNHNFLIMLENMAEGQFINIDKEMELYTDLIKKYCPPGAQVFVKPHPGEQIDRFPIFERMLGNDYNFIRLDNRFKRYPIELFGSFLQQCRIICMFYPSLSLKYLYDIDVIQPMDSALIEKYFEPKFWASYRNAVDLNMLPLQRLTGWNKKSLLYNGR